MDPYAGSKWQPRIIKRENRRHKANKSQKENKMGQKGSKERELFTHVLLSMLKARGTKVSTSQISEFLQHVYEVFPWFPVGGSIDIAIWEKVGEDLKAHYRDNGPAQVPIVTFSLWNLIKECLEPIYESVPWLSEEGKMKSVPSAPPLAIRAAADSSFSDEDVPFDLADKAAQCKKGKYPNDVLLAMVEKSLKKLNMV